MMKRTPSLGVNREDFGVTGSHCPESGLWSPDSDPSVTASFWEGHVFPVCKGIATIWRRRTSQDQHSG